VYALLLRGLLEKIEKGTTEIRQQSVTLHYLVSGEIVGADP
jgi:hypothetical protein